MARDPPHLFIPGRFLTTGYAACFLWPLLAGMVFLAFDRDHRDRAARIIDVLNVRPVSNLAIATGRLVALVAAGWLAAATFAAVLQIGGLAGDHLTRDGNWDGWLGPVEPWSLAGFLFADAPAALALWCALVMFLTAVVRNRAVVVVTALALLGLYAWLLLQVPLRLLPTVSMLSGLGGFASDMLPRFLTTASGVQHAMEFLAAGGLAALAAACMERVDGWRKRPVLVCGAGLVLAAGSGLAVLAKPAFDEGSQRAAWLDAHVLNREAPRADVTRVTAKVAIEPAKTLDIGVTLDMRLPDDDTGNDLVFCLNPGLRVVDLHVDGRRIPYRSESGLLFLAAAEFANRETTLRLTATGVPDARFAYLDSGVDPQAMGIADGYLRNLGAEPMIFSEDYAVLLPGLRWLPASGVNLTDHRPDFFEFDAEVTVPSDWHAVAPGRRTPLGATENSRRFRFRSASPVADVGVVAGRFERRVASRSGIEFELLVHPSHGRSADYFGTAREPALRSIEMQLEQAKRVGLPYPYERFSVVEVPGTLRGFGGGSHMDTVLALPGIALLREYGLPTVRKLMPALGAYPTMLFYTMNDFSGGDPHIALWRSMVRFRAAATGDGAAALDLLTERLTQGVLFGYQPSFFSAHRFDASGSEGPVVEAFDRLMGRGEAVDAELERSAAHVAASSAFVDSVLVDLPFSTDPRMAFEMLNFKGGLLAKTLRHGWSADATAALLRELLRRHGGGTYTLDELKAVAESAGAPLGSVVGDWWAQSALPAFTVSPLEAYRLKDGPGGPRYQLRVHVCNDEAVPGLVRMHCRGDARASFALGRPVPVAPGMCVELGEVIGFRPTAAGIDPYLSRNGSMIRLVVPNIDAEQMIGTEPLIGPQESAWRPPESEGVLVDDLDAGFSQDEGQGSVSDLRIWRRKPTWIRAETPRSWGKYVRSAVWSEPGQGSRSATFRAELPTPGRSRLEYHLPGPHIDILGGSVGMSVRHVTGRRELGLYEMMLVERTDEGEKRTPIEFDGSIAEEGWNRVGDFDLTSSNVSLVVTDRTDGEVVVADAIRWRTLEDR